MVKILLLAGIVVLVFLFGLKLRKIKKDLQQLPTASRDRPNSRVAGRENVIYRIGGN